MLEYPPKIQEFCRLHIVKYMSLTVVILNNIVCNTVSDWLKIELGFKFQPINEIDG